MTAPALAEMAREIERRQPGTLPPEFKYDNRRLWTTCNVSRREIVLHGHLAAAVLRDAMLMATEGGRIRKRDGGPGWEVFHENGDPHEELDSDHGGCPTRSLFAAFCAVFPEPAP